MLDSGYVWTVIVLLGLGTWLIRFSFLGLIGDRPLPLYLRQMLNYTAVAVLPGIAAPIVLNSTEGDLDPSRLMAAGAIILVGIVTQSMLKSILAGLLLFFGFQAVF